MTPEERKELEENDPAWRVFLYMRGAIRSHADALYPCDAKRFLDGVVLPGIEAFQPSGRSVPASKLAEVAAERDRYKAALEVIAANLAGDYRETAHRALNPDGEPDAPAVDDGMTLDARERKDGQ